jgi:hypothetical protein
VVGHYLGHTPAAVQVSAHGEPYESFSEQAPPAGDLYPGTPEAERYIHRHIMTGLAGREQDRLGGHDDPEGNRHDLAECRRAALWLHEGNEYLAKEELRACRRQTREMLKHPLTQAQVAAVAGHLLHRGRLTGEQLASVMSHATYGWLMALSDAEAEALGRTG